MNRPLKYIVVDDEALARDSIKILMKEASEFEFHGEFANGRETLSFLKKESIDLVFLDIQMPKMDGFEVLESVPKEKMPYIIFTTAYDEFALKAFEYNAVDYLLKPYSNDRFYKALEKARKALVGSEHQQVSVEELIQYYQSQKEYRKRLPVKVKDKILLIEVNDIQWIKAADGYLEIGTEDRTYLTNESLKNLEQQLDPKQFVRIHRSTIINLDAVHSLEPYFNGEYHVFLKNQQKFKLSRNYKQSLEIIMDSQ